LNNIVKLIEHSIKRGCWGVKAYENEYGQIFLNDIELFLIKQFESVSKDRADLYKGGFEILYEIVRLNREYGRCNTKIILLIYNILNSVTLSDCSLWIEKTPIKRYNEIKRFVKYMESQFHCLDDKYYTEGCLKNKYVYHLTTSNKIKSIKRKGLIIKKSKCENEIGIYVSDSIHNCLKWCHYINDYIPSENFAIIRFKVKKYDIYVPDNICGYNGDFRFKNNINPNRLEIIF